MSFRDHVRACNRFDLTRFRPFYVCNHHVGWVRDDIARALAHYPATLTVDATAVQLGDQFPDRATRTAALEAVAADLVARGVLGKLRGEHYPVLGPGGDILLTLDRGAVPAFGVRAFGVHLNGYVTGTAGPTHMWIAERARDKRIAPGAYDNLVAGGQPVELSVGENLTKEAREEASLSGELVAQAKPVGALTYCLEMQEGLKPDTLYLYDLAMPVDAAPAVNDDEVARFDCLPVEDVARIVDETDHFKFNCNLVVLDFLIRHGYLSPGRSDYAELIQGLHYPLAALFTSEARRTRKVPSLVPGG